MQHGKIIIQEAQRVIQYAESYSTLHWQMMNVFNTILKRFFTFFVYLQRFYIYMNCEFDFHL